MKCWNGHEMTHKIAHGVLGVPTRAEDFREVTEAEAIAMNLACRECGAGLASAAERRRVRRLRVTPELLVAHFQAGVTAYEIIADALPSDAKIVHIDFDQQRDIVLFVQSETFSPIPVGEIVPELPPPTARRIDA